MEDRPYLIIPDLQIPFEHPKALQFCLYLQKHYRIPKENILCAGDETDGLHASSYPKDPDVDFSAVGELKLSRDRIREWGSYFPLMRLAISNHGLRWIRKAISCDIPSQIIRSYQEIFQTPEGWKWKEDWRFTDLRHPFRLIHGMGYSGKDGHRNAAIDSGMSTIIGHLHSHAAVSHIVMMGAKRIWGMNCGSLIDVDAVAFKYGKYNRQKPTLGAGIICNSGSVPLWIPLE